MYINKFDIISKVLSSNIFIINKLFITNKICTNISDYEWGCLIIIAIKTYNIQIIELILSIYDSKTSIIALDQLVICTIFDVGISSGKIEIINRILLSFKHQLNIYCINSNIYIADLVYIALSIKNTKILSIILNEINSNTILRSNDWCDLVLITIFNDRIDDLNMFLTKFINSEININNYYTTHLINRIIYQIKKSNNFTFLEKILKLYNKNYETIITITMINNVIDNILKIDKIIIDQSNSIFIFDDSIIFSVNRILLLLFFLFLLSSIQFLLFFLLISFIIYYKKNILSLYSDFDILDKNILIVHSFTILFFCLIGGEILILFLFFLSLMYTLYTNKVSWITLKEINSRLLILKNKKNTGIIVINKMLGFIDHNTIDRDLYIKLCIIILKSEISIDCIKINHDIDMILFTSKYYNILNIIKKYANFDIILSQKIGIIINHIYIKSFILLDDLHNEITKFL